MQLRVFAEPHEDSRERLFPASLDRMPVRRHLVLHAVDELNDAVDDVREALG
jgi:hypothetical protein